MRLSLLVGQQYQLAETVQTWGFRLACDVIIEFVTVLLHVYLIVDVQDYQMLLTL